MHQATAQPTRLIAPIAGIYRVDARARWASDAQGDRGLTINRNAVSVANRFEPAASSAQTAVEISTLVQMAAGDYVQVAATETSPVSPVIVGGELGLSFSMHWVSPR